MTNEILVLIIRTIGVYIAIFLVFRLMGKREIGELSVMDLVVFILLAEIAIFAVEKTEQSFFFSMIPMLVLLVIQRLTAYLSLKSVTFRNWLDGRPSVVIRKGEINEDEMKRQRYNMEDLMIQLREKGVIEVSEVEMAVLETNGKLSVFEKKDQPPDVIDPLIMDGQFQEETLKSLSLTKDEVLSMLKRKGLYEIDHVSLAQLNTDGSLFIDMKN
ncbi:hypothetical protein CEY16_04925 [Halalkalibacillus sediminis]|uniref:YetF C-terminal domain-containing protein n=1 Tax=Halalkalibacillus sediminis TaxID=2018042 RepID=A0A2I0QXR0_9BACI|nr:DUF421 domain-containing protein [Halalkalibacillus sediminis]PKR79098.1 hypothetical protein CEY16_04925 [Halalkalibacillus sediminis]